MLPGLAGGTAEGSNRTETLNYCAETWQDSHGFTWIHIDHDDMDISTFKMKHQETT